MKKVIILSLILIISFPSLSFSQQGEELERRFGQNFTSDVDLTQYIYEIAAHRKALYGHNDFIPELSEAGLFPNDPALFQALLNACDNVAPRALEVMKKMEDFKGIITMEEFIIIFKELYNQVSDSSQPINKMYGISSLYTCTHTHIGEGGSYRLLTPRFQGYQGLVGQQNPRLISDWGLTCEFGRMQEPLLCGMKIRYQVNTGESIRGVLTNLISDNSDDEIKKVYNDVKFATSMYEKMIAAKEILNLLKKRGKL